MSLFRWMTPVCRLRGVFHGKKTPLSLLAELLVLVWGGRFYEIRSIPCNWLIWPCIHPNHRGAIRKPACIEQLNISHLLVSEFAPVENTQRYARENKSPCFTPAPLKHIRDVFRLFRISSGRIIVILCFPQTLKNDFMLIAAWTQGKWERSDFPLNNKHPIFPGSLVQGTPLRLHG